MITVKLFTNGAQQRAKRQQASREEHLNIHKNKKTEDRDVRLGTNKCWTVVSERGVDHSQINCCSRGDRGFGKFRVNGSSRKGEFVGNKIVVNILSLKGPCF